MQILILPIFLASPALWFCKKPTVALTSMMIFGRSGVTVGSRGRFTIRAVAAIKVGRDGKTAGAGETLGHVPHELVDAALMLNDDASRGTGPRRPARSDVAAIAAGHQLGLLPTRRRH